MPSYDFRCQDCRETFTAFVSVSKRDDVRCEKCAGSNVKQLVTSFYHSGSGKGTKGVCTRSHCGSCTSCR